MLKTLHLNTNLFRKSCRLNPDFYVAVAHAIRRGKIILHKLTNPLNYIIRRIYVQLFAFSQ